MLRSPILCRLSPALRVIVVAAIASAMFSAVSAGADEIRLTHEIFLEKGYLPTAKVIVPTNDNGFVVAGANRGQAWAVRADAAGNIKWRHWVPRPTKPVRVSDIPTYDSAAIMRDESVFLCGNMPGDRGRRTGLLTHVDNNGNVLSEQLLVPEGFHVGEILSCITWNDGVVVIGGTSKIEHVEPTDSHPLPYNSQRFHWLLYLDTNGDRQWEKLVLIPEELQRVDDISPLQPALDGGFVFAARRNGIGTEVLHIGKDGEVVARKLLEKAFTIALPVHADLDVQLVSTSEPDPLTRITLNSDLRETGRIIGKQEAFGVRMAYRGPDNALVLFGSVFDSVWFKHYLDAGIMTLDPALQHKQIKSLSPRHDAYWIETSAPLSKPGEFVCIQSDDGYVQPQGGPPPDDAYPGLALHFVTVK